MIQAVPTAERIQQQQSVASAADFPSEFFPTESIPTLQCEITSDGKQIRFRCGYCNRYHYHGNVPKDSPDKGHRVARCLVKPSLYPNGYYLRTDLDQIFQKRYPNFAVISSTEKAFNAHYRKCKRLELPMVAVRCERNYAWVDIDFVTVNYCMDRILGMMVSMVGVEYRRLYQHLRKGKKGKRLGYLTIDSRDRRETAMFWIYINDAYRIADALMPFINDRSYWIRLGIRARGY